MEPATDDPTEISRTITLDDLDARFADTSSRFQQDVVVAQFAEVLRGSEYVGAWNLAELVPFAYDVADQLPHDDQVAEFADLVRRAARLERP